MENKYYTPEIEEFHVGFEFEYIGATGGWEECSFGNDEIIHSELEQFKDELMKVAHSTNRVKYLDREDIESLGFKLYHSDLSLTNTLWFDAPYFDERKAKDLVSIQYNTHSNWALITIANRTKDGKSTDHVVKFSGFVKNKSELKKLMSMLNIK